MGKEAVHMRLGNKDPLVVGNKVFKSFNDWDLTEKEIEKARIELGETEERKQECLQELKRRLSKEGNYRTDDDFLLRYLRVRKFDCDRAYKQLKHFYETRKNPEFFGNSSSLRSSNFYDFVSTLPYTDEEGSVLARIDAGKWNPQQSFAEPMRHLGAISELTTMNPKCQINGGIAVLDVKGMTAMHLSELLRKGRIRTLVDIIFSSMPWRIKKFVVINTGRIARIGYSAFRPFLSRKIAERIILLGSDLSELHQHVNPAILPKELGGMLKVEECKEIPSIEDNMPYFEYDRSFSGD